MQTDLVWLELDLVLEVVGPMGWLVVVEVVDLSFVAVQFVGLVVGSRVVQEVVLGSEVEVCVDVQAVDLVVDLVVDLGAVLEFDLVVDLVVDQVLGLGVDMVVDLGVDLVVEFVDRVEGVLMAQRIVVDVEQFGCVGVDSVAEFVGFVDR